MKTKNKFIIACCSIGVIALGGIIALIAVIASFNAKVTGGGIRMSYTAYDIDASITAEYYVGADMTAQEFMIDGVIQIPDNAFTIIQTSDNKDLIEFLGEDGKSETKSFKDVDVTVGRKQAIYIKYTITNLSVRSTCLVSGICRFGENTKNASVYAYNLEYVDNTPPNGFWSESTTEDPILKNYFEDTFTLNPVSTLGHYSVATLYIKIVPTVPTKDMTFDGSFDFTLVGDPE